MFSCSRCRGVLCCVLACLSLVIANTAVAGTTVPAPWIAADIGGPALTGSTTYSNGAFTVSAGGAGITGRSDQFHFVYQALTGDATIFARVDALASVDANSRVGLMIRGALSANAVNAFAYVSGASGIGLSRRTSGGGRTTTTTWSSRGAPVWLALRREGTTLTGYASTDGSTWQTMLATTITLNQTIYVGIATSASSSTQRTLATVSGVAFGNRLPNGQQAADIGSPTPAGSTSFSAGTYIVRAGGLDIGSTSDQFHFVYQQITGDVDVIARVASVTAADAASRAGVMVRASLSPSAAFAYAVLSASAGYGFEWRYTSGASASVTNGGAGAPSGWVRLTRSGGQFNAYRSADGQKWTLVESTNVAMPTTVYVGLAVTSRRSGTATTATIDNLRVSASASSNGAPTVTLTAPIAGQSWTAPAGIALAANASDPENRLSRVEFYANGSFVGSDAAAPFGVTWSSVPAGTYAVTARAFDADGGQAESASVSISVTSPNSPPSVSLTSPASGQSLTVGSSVTLAATASDPEGRMSRVEFFVNDTFLAADTSPPYSAPWAPTSAGPYSLTAVAFDTDGGRTASSAVAVTVSAPTTVPPRYAAFTASSDHATTVVTGYRLNIYAAGANTTTATPIATSDLGKPTPDAQQTITVDRGSFFASLPSGSYLGTVTAFGPGGSAQSAPPVSFIR